MSAVADSAQYEVSYISIQTVFGEEDQLLRLGQGDIFGVVGRGVGCFLHRRLEAKAKVHAVLYKNATSETVCSARSSDPLSSGRSVTMNRT